MFIQRVQIEEGFLDGLDILLDQGLNVVIGARGTGKTSLIELIRFCLGVPGSTHEATRRSRDHALSVLGSGQITVTLAEDAGPSIQVTRSASDEKPRSNVAFPKPAVFSQTEIETVGLQAIGRLKLIDGFASWEPESALGEQQAVADFASITLEADKVRREIDELEKQLAQQPLIAQQLEANLAPEKAIAHHSVAIAEKTTSLDQLSQQISVRAVHVAEGERVQSELGAWYAAVKAAVDAPPSMSLSIGVVSPEALKKTVIQIQVSLTEAMETISKLYYQVKSGKEGFAEEKLQLENSARQLRKEVEELSEGAGIVLRKGQQLRETQAKLVALKEFSTSRRNVLQKLLAKRSAASDRLDEVREKRFKTRSEVVVRLNKLLGPRIRLKLFRNAQIHAFESAIAEALKGSGLRFADIAAALAEKLSPRALLEAIDTFDQTLVAQVADISAERAARALTHLRTSDLATLGGIDIDDDVTFQLLDGKDYKDFNQLSTGQRCTVVLPMVLAHKDRIIIVDQPEDHIDNAFIADTLIKAILARDTSSQILFSTHNPNIPVLGEAERVLQLGSDGRRGFALVNGALDDLGVVSAISNVMEGGSEAFAKRSRFYAQAQP